MLLSSRISSLLKIAAVLLGVALCASTVSAQEPLQFNVPYRCPDGITMIVTRCQSNARGEVCFWREEKNGQLVTEAYSARGQMAGRLQACRVESGTPAGQPANGQALNPPYLKEMPSVERVLREMQADDPAETAARQMGTFLQLKKIIENIAGPRLYHNQLTPDETRFIGEYYAAYSRIAQSRPEYGKFPALKGYDISPQFRDELFQRFFSPAVRAEYEKVDAAFAAQHQARVQADNQAYETAKAQAAAAQAQQAEKAKDQQAIARCISAGRSEFDCLGETMKKEVGGMLGAVDPRLKQEFTTAPGLRVSGLYGGSGFALVFPPDQDYVSLACGELVMDPHNYTVENTGSRITLKITSEPQTLVLAFNPNGNLSGSGPVDVKGRVIVGHAQQWVETRRVSDNSVVAGSGHSADVPIYKEKVEHCNAGTIALKGAAPALSATSVLTGLAILQQSEKAVTGSKDFKVPPGLRLIGDYAGQGGFTVEFRRESATLGCGQAVAAHSYTIQITGNQVLAKIGDDGSPIVLTLLADGKLSGSGQVHVAGRALTGVKQDPTAASNDQLVFAPTSANCNVGTLALTTDSTPTEFEAGAAAARASLPHPSGPVPTATPVNPSASASAAGAGGNAVLSLMNGFPTRPGAPNALSGNSLVLLKESFEDALTKSGLQSAPGMTAIQSWAAACNKGAPECQQGAAAGMQFKVASTKMDLDGKAQFSGVPAGTYYLFGFTQYNNHHFVWNLKVELRPGANSVTLDQNNATKVD